jgi:superfamily I DNA/RNA helicase
MSRKTILLFPSIPYRETETQQPNIVSVIKEKSDVLSEKEKRELNIARKKLETRIRSSVNKLLILGFDKIWEELVDLITFHSLCTSILRIEARQIGLPADFVVYDDADCLGLIKDIFGLSEHQELQNKFSQVSNCKLKASHLQLSPNYPLEKLFASLGIREAQLASQYQATLQERHALDFADLIFYVRSMLYSYPEIRQTWEKRFDFIQVDNDRTFSSFNPCDSASC